MTPNPNKTLAQLFPEFQIYTPEQLAKLTPEQLVAVLQQLGKIKNAVSSESIKLETQLSSIEQQIDQTQTAIRTEFNVETLGDLETLQQSLLTQIDAQYKALSETLPQ
jgi:hypothetical protein